MKTPLEIQEFKPFFARNKRSTSSLMSNCKTAFLSQPVLLGIIAIAQKILIKTTLMKLCHLFHVKSDYQMLITLMQANKPPKNVRLMKEYA